MQTFPAFTYLAPIESAQSCTIALVPRPQCSHSITECVSGCNGVCCCLQCGLVFDVGTGAVLPVCHHEDPRWLDRLSPSLTCCLRCGRVSSDLSNRLSPECLSFASLCSHAPALHAADHHGDDLRECDLQALREVDDEDMMDSSFDSYSSSSSETAFTSGLNISTSTQSDHDSSLEAHPFEAHRPSALVLPSATGFSTSMSSGTTTSSSSPPPSFPSTPSSTSGRLESISEVYADLLRTERRQLRHSHYQAPQSPGLSASPMSPTFEGTGCLRYIKHRRVLVDWITEVCESHHMCRLTIHCACLHLDRVLSRVMVARNRLQLVATACILIAAKFNENEQRLPTLGELTAHTHNAYSTELIKEMELMVLGSIEWTVKVAVPIHFLEYFFEQGLLVAGDCVDSMPLCAENFEQTRRRLYKYLQFFCDCCQQEYHFQEFAPSHLAAAIVCASRRLLRIQPWWPSALVALTGYDECTIQRALLLIEQHYRAHFAAPLEVGLTPVALP